MNFNVEYESKIVSVKGELRYFVLFIDVRKSRQIIEVSKKVFLQFFGVHSRTANRNQYLIVHKEHEQLIEQVVTKEEYKHYQSFKSIQIRESSIYDRYIEHMELNESQLYRKAFKEHTAIIDQIYHNDLVKGLYKEVLLLPKVQRRRVVLHYFKGYSLAQIAYLEHCSKSSIQCSITIAIRTLKGRMEKYILGRPYD